MRFQIVLFMLGFSGYVEANRIPARTGALSKLFGTHPWLGRLPDAADRLCSRSLLAWQHYARVQDPRHC